MNEEKLERLIEDYIEIPEDERYGFKEREERKKYYQSFNYNSIIKMEDKEVMNYLNKLWNVLGIAKYKIYDRNGHKKFKKKLANLLYGNDSFKKRYDDFHNNIIEFKLSAMSEVLSYNYPDKFMIWNEKVKTIFQYLEINHIPTGRDNVTYEWYMEMVNYGIEIKNKLEKKTKTNMDLVDADYFYETIYKKEFGNNTEFGKLINNYIDTAEDHIPKEIYKWKAINCFKKNWNLHSDNFPEMLKKSLAQTGNLLNSKNCFPQGMIIAFAELYPDKVKKAFEELYNEKESLEKRYMDFIKQCDEILKTKWTKDRQHYQGAKSISVYLTLMYPNKYYIYKPSISKKVLVNLGKNIDDDNEKIPKEKKDYNTLDKYFKACDKLLKEVKKSSKLKQALNKYLDDDCYKDDDCHMLLQDVLYYGKDYYKIISEKEEEKANEKANENVYKKNDFEKDAFIDKYDEIKELLDYKDNIILQGAPGVGKTYMAKRLAYSLMGEKNDDRIEFIQFHQSYSYEEFIEGYIPNGKDGFKLEDGIFKRFCQKANNDKENDYYFIIDEINRGNLSKIFGELLLLIEKDKRKESITLPYSKEQFNIPENIKLIGMMNTADRGLAILDYALRRRFAFIDIDPAFENEKFKKYLKELKNDYLNDVIDKVIELNKEICDDSSLGKGFQIGHSYFCNLDSDVKKEKIDLIIKYEILPLLKEYWFDSNDKYDTWKNKFGV